MRKKWMIALIIGALILSGCSETTSNDTDIVSEVETTIEAEGGTIAPERKSEVYGVVSKIIGNEITVNLVEKNTSNDVELTEEEKEAKRLERQALSSEEKKADRDATTVLSNELVDVVIPVGTAIVMGSGTDGGELVKLELLDINKGTTIRIWLFEEGGGETGIAEYVQVLSN